MLLVAALIAGCGSPAPSPSAVTSASVPVAPTSSTVADEPGATSSQRSTMTPSATPDGGWPVAGAALPIFDPDGTIYTIVGEVDGAQQLVALDARGRVKPGWPFRFSNATAVRVSGEPVVGHDGSLYVTACGFPTGPCSLHDISSGGLETLPWPVRLTGMADCSGPAAGPDGTIYVTCPAGSTDGDAGLTIAVDPAAGVGRGWPVEIGGRSLAVAPDGTVYVGWWQPSDDPTAPPLSVTALAPDGSRLPGWPVSLPADLSLFTPGPNGTLYLGWYEGRQDGEGGFIARRTVHTALGPEGQPLPGWPRGSVGASTAALGPDGTLYYATAAGNLYAHDRAGQIKAGWPVRDVAASGMAGSPVYVSPLGSIYVLTAAGVTALAPEGRSLADWPWSPGPAASLSSCWRATPCANDVTDQPAFAPDDTVYVTVYREVGAAGNIVREIDAIDPNGDAKPGWPISIAATGSWQGLRVGPDGRVYVRGDLALDALMPDGARVK